MIWVALPSFARRHLWRLRGSQDQPLLGGRSGDLTGIVVGKIRNIISNHQSNSFPSGFDQIRDLHPLILSRQNHSHCPVYPIEIPVTQQTLRSCSLDVSSFGLPRLMLGPEILTHSGELGTCSFMSMMRFLERQDAGLIEGYHWIEFSQRNDHNRSCNDQSPASLIWLFRFYRQIL